MLHKNPFCGYDISDVHVLFLKDKHFSICRMPPEKVGQYFSSVFIHCSVVHRYLERFDEEMEQINIIQGISARKSNQHAPRESAIRLTLQKERTDFETCGIGT